MRNSPHVAIDDVPRSLQVVRHDNQIRQRVRIRWGLSQPENSKMINSAKYRQIERCTFVSASCRYPSASSNCPACILAAARPFNRAAEALYLSIKSSYIKAASAALPG